MKMVVLLLTAPKTVRHVNKIYLVLALLFALSACSVGKKCNHLCHCIEADHSDCKCENCECMQREEDKTYESGGVVIDSTQDCEACE